MASFRINRLAPIAGMLLAVVSTAPGMAQQTPAKDPTIFLKQGWSDEDRLKFYYTSQGTAIAPYDLFLNLEEANSPI